MQEPDYEDRFEVPRSTYDSRPAIEWLHTALEEARAPTRAFLLLGWRAVLLMRLEPGAPDTVLGWRIAENDPVFARLHVESPLMSAAVSVSLETGSSAVWNTEIWYRTQAARPIWLVVGPIHRQIVPNRLRVAAKRLSRPGEVSTAGPGSVDLSGARVRRRPSGPARVANGKEADKYFHGLKSEPTGRESPQ